jgi:hypothetical protein
VHYRNKDRAYLGSQGAFALPAGRYPPLPAPDIPPQKHWHALAKMALKGGRLPSDVVREISIREKTEVPVGQDAPPTIKPCSRRCVDMAGSRLDIRSQAADKAIKILFKLSHYRFCHELGLPYFA